MKKLFALLLLAAVVAFPGCNSSTGNDDNGGDANTGGNTGNTGSASTYLPFKAGNSWTYTSTDDYTGTSTTTDTVLGNTTVDNKSYWIIQSLESGAPVDTTYFRVADNNLYTFYDASMYGDMGVAKNMKLAGAFKAAVSDLGMEVIMAKFGVSAGTAWTIYDITLTSGEKVSVKGKYLGLDSAQTTAGNFSNCAKFEMTTSYSGTSEGMSFSVKITADQWYAPNVGPVKMTTSMEYTYAGQKMTSTGSDILKSYTVK